MTKILVFGRTGQLARCLVDAGRAFPQFEMIFLDRAACDLSQPASVIEVVDDAKPDAVINAAAYTAVDQAETDRHLAHTINGAAVGIGVTMQLPMDIRIASDNARFGFVFNKRGINPEAASSWFLRHLVGVQQALEYA